MNNETLLLAAHGSSRLNGNNPVLPLSEKLSDRNIFNKVLYAFLQQQPQLDDVLSQIQTQELSVIPMFSGFGYITEKLIPKALGQVSSKIKVRLFDPIGIHSEIPVIMAKQVLSIIKKYALEPAKVSVLIVAHGHTKSSQNADQTKVLACNLKKLMNRIEISTAFIEETPLISDWTQITTTKCVIVVPYLVGGGLHTQEDIPIMLGMISGDYEKTPVSGPHNIQGRTIWYCRPFGFDEALAEIIIKLVSK